MNTPQSKFRGYPLQVNVVGNTPTQYQMRSIQHLVTIKEATPRFSIKARPMSQKMFNCTKNKPIESVLALQYESMTLSRMKQQVTQTPIFRQRAFKKEMQFTDVLKEKKSENQEKSTKAESNAKQLEYFRRTQPDIFEPDRDQIFRLQKQALTYQQIHSSDMIVNELENRIKQQKQQRQSDQNYQKLQKTVSIAPDVALTRVKIPSYVELLYDYYTSPEIIEKRK